MSKLTAMHARVNSFQRTFRSTHSSQITPAAEIAAKISNNHQYQFIGDFS